MTKPKTADQKKPKQPTKKDTLAALRKEVYPLDQAGSVMRRLLEERFVRVEQPYFDDFVADKLRSAAKPKAVTQQPGAQPRAALTHVSMALLVQWADRFGYEQTVREKDRGTSRR